MIIHVIWNILNPVLFSINPIVWQFTQTVPKYPPTWQCNPLQVGEKVWVRKSLSNPKIHHFLIPVETSSNHNCSPKGKKLTLKLLLLTLSITWVTSVNKGILSPFSKKEKRKKCTAHFDLFHTHTIFTLTRHYASNSFLNITSNLWFDSVSYVDLDCKWHSEIG